MKTKLTITGNDGEILIDTDSRVCGAHVIEATGKIVVNIYEDESPYMHPTMPKRALCSKCEGLFHGAPHSAEA